MSKTVKALILTWVMIGFLIAGGVGFYLGRTTAPKIQELNPSGMQPQGGMMPQGGFGQPPPGANQGLIPSSERQGGQQNPPTGGEQPPPLE